MGILDVNGLLSEDDAAMRKLQVTLHEEFYNIKVVKTKPGECSPKPVYLAFEGGYMYQGNTLEECLQDIASGWRQDKNICDTDM